MPDFTPELDQERRDDCRREVLAFLSARQAVAHHPQSVRRGVNRGHEFDFTLAEIEAALAFRVSADHVRVVYPEGGSTSYYQATSNGVLAYERGPATA
jgi:hypothetical protein